MNNASTEHTGGSPKNQKQKTAFFKAFHHAFGVELFADNQANQFVQLILRLHPYHTSSTASYHGDHMTQRSIRYCVRKGCIDSHLIRNVVFASVLNKYDFQVGYMAMEEVFVLPSNLTKLKPKDHQDKELPFGNLLKYISLFLFRRLSKVQGMSIERLLDLRFLLILKRTGYVEEEEESHYYSCLRFVPVPVTDEEAKRLKIRGQRCEKPRDQLLYTYQLMEEPANGVSFL